MNQVQPIQAARRLGPSLRPSKGAFIMTLVIVVLGFYLIYPVLLLLINSFNVARDMFVPPAVWGLDNWRLAWRQPDILESIGNTFLVWSLTVGISFPVAVVISWVLARTRIPFSHTLEFLFWISFMMPGISTTLSWILLLDGQFGMLNVALEALPFINDSPFDIYSVPGIVWAHIMANGISLKVMLLTPAFRNMDASLEEAARVGGANNVSTMLRVTLPLMVSPMALVFALQMLRIFQSFETEFLLGLPIGFFVYSTLIYKLVATEVIPQYGQATVLASITLLVIALIIPLQRWILQRRRYITISGQFKPGLIDLGAWKWVIFGTIALLLFLLTIGPALVLILGSFMTRAGWFDINPVFSLRHWDLVLNDGLFLKALRTTLILAITAAIASPLLFSMIAYILVRTKWPGRLLLDTIIWGSGAIPGILSGLGLLWLFLGTPVLLWLYGTIYALIIVVIIQGNTTGTNIMKGVFVQIGQDMEEAARISGAGWTRTYFRIWIPLLMPTLVLLATLNFVIAAGTTASIILIASRDTMTLSLLALEFASPGTGLREEASIVGIFIMFMTVGLASVARAFGLNLSVRHDTRARDAKQAAARGAAPAPAR